MRRCFSPPILAVAILGWAFLAVPTAPASDWLNWRGPLQTGQAFEKPLPDDFDPREAGKKNLIWKAPYGCRSTPLVMDGRVFIINAEGETPKVPTQKEKMLIGERVMCFDAVDGKVIWEQHFNVFHSDIVTNRLGWSPLAADPENKLIYAHTTAGFLVCMEAATGKIVWERQLTEEFGRVTGYGGRIGGGPLWDSGLVIVGIINSSWGDQAQGANRLVAFDGKTGKVVWWSLCSLNRAITYSSNPTSCVINGERIVVTGGGEGGMHAFQLRTGKKIWSFPCALGMINPSPVVNGNYVYISHGEDNPEGAEEGLGRVVCVDGSKVKDEKPELVWEYRKGVRFGLASPAYADGSLYVPDDGAKLYCFDALKGTLRWKYNYGTVARGAPLIADGKIYISESNARFRIIKLQPGDKKPDETLNSFNLTFKNQPDADGFVESHCTPAVADGKVFLATRDEMYCIGLKNAKVVSTPMPKQNEEAASDGKVAQLLIYPAEVSAVPGETLEFEVRGYTANGQLVKDAKIDAKWSIGVPPIPKGATTAPPKLDCVLDEKTGKLTVNAKKPAQQGYLDVSDGKLTARARIRVVPQIPYKQDFEMVPEGAAPASWINATGKYRVVTIDENGKPNKVLFKVNNDSRPPFSRANAYIVAPNSTGYTIESDVKCIEVRGKLPDAGIIGNRYTLYLDGKPNADGKLEVKLLTWESLTPRPEGRVLATKDINWKSGTWYHLKLAIVLNKNDGIIRGKVWERGQPEPTEWTLEMTDPRPNREGSAGLYGYVTNVLPDAPGSEIYYDNIVIK